MFGVYRVELREGVLPEDSFGDGIRLLPLVESPVDVSLPERHRSVAIVQVVPKRSFNLDKALQLVQDLDDPSVLSRHDQLLLFAVVVTEHHLLQVVVQKEVVVLFYTVHLVGHLLRSVVLVLHELDQVVVGSVRFKHELRDGPGFIHILSEVRMSHEADPLDKALSEGPIKYFVDDGPAPLPALLLPFDDHLKLLPSPLDPCLVSSGQDRADVLNGSFVRLSLVMLLTDVVRPD